MSSYTYLICSSVTLSCMSVQSLRGGKAGANDTPHNLLALNFTSKQSQGRRYPMQECMLRLNQYFSRRVNRQQRILFWPNSCFFATSYSLLLKFPHSTFEFSTCFANVVQGTDRIVTGCEKFSKFTFKFLYACTQKTRNLTNSISYLKKYSSNLLEK